MKSYTDIERSKRLTEILPLESADMFYDQYGVIRIGKPKERYSNYHQLPVWSLAALLDVIPSGKALIHDKGNLGYKCICNNMDTYFHDNPVDACYEMIIKLHELKML